MIRDNDSWLALIAVVALLLPACGGKPEGTAPAVAQTVAVTVSPDSARLGPLESFALEASVTGTANTTVEWTVQGGAASGSIQPDGWYTAPAASGTYRVVATSRADPTKSATATVTVSGPRPAVNGAPMTTAHRTAGVAPLFVFFDAVDEQSRTFTGPGTETTFAWASGVVQPADKEGTQYSWDFGDPASGAWTWTGNSRNTATGYTAGHLFERPGTYSVTLTVTETDGTVSTYVQTISVAAFSGTTGYASAGGTGPAPGTEQDPTSLAAGIAWVNAAPNRGLLLKRGDSFTAGDITIGVAQGPGQAGFLGAYGTGPRPVVNYTGLDSAITLWNAHDFRVMDLSVVGPGMNTAGIGGVGGIQISGQQTRNALVLRNASTGFRTGLGNTQSVNDAATPHDANAWIENEIGPGNRDGNLYCGGRRLAVIGNYIHDAPLTHLFRTYQTHKGVVSNNRLFNPGPTRGAMKLGGMGHDTAWPRTYYTTVTDNLVRGDTWSVSISPQNTAEDERVSHFIVERNHFWAKPTVQADLVVEAHDVMIRNNVFDATGSFQDYRAVYLMTRHPGAPPDAGTVDVRIYNNTVVQRDAHSTLQLVTLESGTEDIQAVTVRNNIVYGPLTSAVSLYQLEGGRSLPASYAGSNNLVDPASSPFVDAANENYELAVTSEAAGAGQTLPEVREDFVRKARPRGSPDVGAFQTR